MNYEELSNQLEHLDLPEVELPTHQRQLKMALLNSATNPQPIMIPPLRILAPLGALAAVLIVALGFYSSGTPHTYAAELAAKSMQALSQLSDVQKDALDAHLSSEAEGLLSQALKAKDLQVLSPDAVAGTLYPSSWIDALTNDERASFEARLASEDLRGAQFLQFTDRAGQKVIVAINQGDLPVYQLAGIGTKDADEAAGVRALVENFGQQLKFLSLLSPTAADDMATRYQSYVAPELLSAWEADPLHAVGRLTSSPWPEGIVVTAMHKTNAGTYVVEGKILEVTSAEITQNAAIARPITLTVSNIDSHWLITAVSVQAQ